MESKEMIKVMQHYENGGEVEFKAINTSDPVWISSCPSWDWETFEYRIKKEKVTIENGYVVTNREIL